MVILKKTSSGEKEIIKYLEINNIEYSGQKTFNDLKMIGLLRFDFYLPKQNICIEYDGEQHFKIIEYFGSRSEYMKRRHRDKLKDQYCLDNNIKLIRIPYTKYKEIETIITRLLC